MVLTKTCTIILPGNPSCIGCIRSVNVPTVYRPGQVFNWQMYALFNPVQDIIRAFNHCMVNKSDPPLAGNFYSHNIKCRQRLPLSIPMPGSKSLFFSPAMPAFNVRGNCRNPICSYPRTIYICIQRGNQNQSAIQWCLKCAAVEQQIYVESLNVDRDAFPFACRHTRSQKPLLGGRCPAYVSKYFA